MHLRMATTIGDITERGSLPTLLTLGKNLQRIWNITGSFFRERVRKSEADS